MEFYTPKGKTLHAGPGGELLTLFTSLWGLVSSKDTFLQDFFDSKITFSLVTRSCLTIHEPMDCSTPGFPVHHQLKFAQTHVHPVGDAIQPSHALPSPSPPAFGLAPNQELFKRVSSHQVAKVMEFQLQHQSFQWIFRIDFLQNWLVGSPCSPRDSQESSPTPQFKSINSSVLLFP